MIRPYRLTDHQKIDILRRSSAGESYAQLARYFGCTTENIRKIVERRRRFAETPPEERRRKLTDEMKIEIVDRYRLGESTVKLGDAYGCSFQNIGKLLERRGVLLR